MLLRKFKGTLISLYLRYIFEPQNRQFSHPVFICIVKHGEQNRMQYTIDMSKMYLHQK